MGFGSPRSALAKPPASGERRQASRRPWAARSSSTSSWGSARPMRPSRPATSGAAQSALSTASSVASTDCLEHVVEVAVGHVRSRRLSAWPPPGRGERDEDLAAAVMADRAAAREPEAGPPSDPLELVRREWSVDRDDCDAASGLGASCLGGLAEQIAHRDAVHDEARWRVEVRENEDAHCATDRWRDPARRPDPGLVALRHHPGPAANRTLGDGSARRLGDRSTDVGRLDLDDASLGEPAVVALTHDGDDEVLRADARIGSDGDLDRAVVDAADGVRGRQVHRRLDQSPLADHQRARELTRPVQHCRSGGDGRAEDRLDRTRAGRR